MIRPAQPRLLILSLLGASLLCPLRAQDLGAGVAAPTADQKFTATIDAANRWVQDVGGSEQVYRSIVNLGEGPRIFSGQGRYTDPGGKYADRINFSAYGWGGDPYNTARVDAELADVYRFRFDYRNVVYFNNLPEFANPLLAEGSTLSQRALDMTLRQLDTELEVKPGATVSPFVAFSRNSDFGRGVTTFVEVGNEFPVSTDLDNTLTSARGGVRLNFERYNFTLEQGGTTFDDEQRVFFDEGGNRGNRRSPFLGQELILDAVNQLYDIDGSSIFNRGVVQGRPWDRLNFSGQFLYSQPKVDVAYNQEAAGSFVLLQGLTPYTFGLEQSLGAAKRPHSSGSWNTEIRPVDRLRIVQSWFTDRFHVSGGSVLRQTFNTVPETTDELAFNRLLVLNYNQHQVDAIFDINPNVTVRGGHRYVWGDAETPPPSLQLTPEPRNMGEVRRNVGLAGATFRVGPKFSTTVDFEASPGDEVFFRTSLNDYRRFTIRSRYRPHRSLLLHGSFAFLDNENPEPDINLDLRSQRTSLSLFWTPNNGQRFSILAEYTRATYRSDILIVTLPFLGEENSRYRYKGHEGSAFGEVRLAQDVLLRFGGSLIVNKGTLPTRFYQPQARLSVPVVQRFSWTAEWRWYGFDREVFKNENFRTNTFSTGLLLEL